MVSPQPSPTSATQPSPPIQYSDNPEFNNWFDQQYKEIKAQGNTYYFSKTASEIVFELDPVAYEAALQEYRAEQLEGFKEIVMDDFPRPIAYYFFCTERNYETEKQRLERLKDTWEAIIFTIFALVVSECRYIQLPLKGVQRPDGQNLILAHFKSDRLFDKLQIIETLLNRASTLNRNLVTTSLIDVQTLAKIRTLNQTRNEFSHIAALSEVQSQQEYLDSVSEVIDILQSVNDLQNVQLLRFRSATGNALLIQCESFTGHKLAREMPRIPISNQILATVGNLLNDTHIIAQHNGLIFGLEPFIHYRLDATGQTTDLCFFKRLQGNDIEFEVVAHSISITLPANQFQYVFNELATLLNT